MRLLIADENFPLPSVKKLRAEGHDVYAVAELDASIPDETVIEKAIAEGRIILGIFRNTLFAFVDIKMQAFPAPCFHYCLIEEEYCLIFKKGGGVSDSTEVVLLNC